MASDTLIIVNPRSRGGRTGKVWRALYPTVESALGACDVAEAGGECDARRSARRE